MVACHYAPGWTKEFGGADLEWLVGMSRALNKRLAHITAYRQRVPDNLDARQVNDVHEHLSRVVDAWRDMLTPEQNEWFDDPQRLKPF